MNSVSRGVIPYSFLAIRPEGKILLKSSYVSLVSLVLLRKGTFDIGSLSLCKSLLVLSGTLLERKSICDIGGSVVNLNGFLGISPVFGIKGFEDCAPGKVLLLPLRGGVDSLPNLPAKQSIFDIGGMIAMGEISSFTANKSGFRGCSNIRFTMFVNLG